MAKLDERVSIILAKIINLKEKVNAADGLTSALEKDKDKLPASAKTALTAYGKKTLRKVWKNANWKKTKK